jgi:hypothetical protein
MTALRHPPQVTVEVGPPVPLGLEDPVADTTAVMAAIAALLPAEAQAGRIPTDNDLARTRPPA